MHKAWSTVVWPLHKTWIVDDILCLKHGQLLFNICLFVSRFKIKHTISYRGEWYLLPPPTPPPHPPNKMIIKNQTNNSWVYRDLPMNIHLHTTNTFYPVHLSPLKKLKQNKTKKRKQRQQQKQIMIGV